jgi:hypothetical protein
VVTAPKHQKEKRSTDYFAGLDVSVKDTSVCIVDGTGKIVREVKVASEPQALLAVLRNATYCFKRIGLEAGPLSPLQSLGILDSGCERNDENRSCWCDRPDRPSPRKHLVSEQADAVVNDVASSQFLARVSFCTDAPLSSKGACPTGE